MIWKRFEKLPDDAANQPIHRILNTILMYGIWHGSHLIRIEPRAGYERGTGTVSVFYHLNDEWREYIKMPLYVLNDLMKSIRGLQTSSREKRGRENAIEIQWCDEVLNLTFSVLVTVEFTPTELGESALLRLSLPDES